MRYNELNEHSAAKLLCVRRYTVKEKRISDILDGISEFFKRDIFISVITLLAAIGILVSSIFVGENIFTTLPLYVSLIIGIFSSGANRYGSLIGSINCIFYTVVYIFFGLYAQALQALLISCPIQMVTFLRWNKRAYKSSTRFKSLKLWQILAISAASVAAYVIIMLALKATDASHPYIDNAITVISTVQTILALLIYREYSWVALPTCILLVVLDIIMIPGEPIRIAYLFYSAHALICAIKQFISVRRICLEQGREADAVVIPDGDATQI